MSSVRPPNHFASRVPQTEMPSMAPKGISSEDKSPQMPDKTYKDEKKIDDLLRKMRTTIRRQGALSRSPNL